jgi:hypothetical protein
VIYGWQGRRVEVEAADLAEADHIARAASGRVEFVAACPPGARRYRTRAAALAASTGPAYACADHWHASPLDAAA